MPKALPTLKFFGLSNFGKIMGKKKSLADVILAFKEKWGDRYIYDNITNDNYVNMGTKVPVICRKHGLFRVRPSDHILGVGCKRCGEKRWGAILGGIAINDSDTFIKDNKAYSTWVDMIRRCYDKGIQKKRPTYTECYVCKEWMHFSNFKKWFDENYVDGYALDKDILVKGNKVYSPETCCFVPQEINSIFKERNKKRSLPIGVYKYGNRYRALCTMGIKKVNLGIFNSIQDAEIASIKARRDYLTSIATENYDCNKINKKVFDAIINRINNL